MKTARSIHCLIINLLINIKVTDIEGGREGEGMDEEAGIVQAMYKTYSQTCLRWGAMSKPAN